MPMPTPRNPLSPTVSRTARIAVTISAIMTSRPAEYCTLADTLSIIWPSLSIAAARRFVPPKSTPIAYSYMRSNDNKLGAGFLNRDPGREHKAGMPRRRQHFDNDALSVELPEEVGRHPPSDN